MIQETLWNGIKVLQIENEFCKGMMALHGGHVLSYIPSGEKKDILWRSASSWYKTGKPLRGGIPVCWPWFGPVPEPAHGLARLEDWTIAEKSETKDGAEILMTFSKNGLSLSIRTLFGSKLEIGLTTVNNGKTIFRLTEALHTYFNISDILNVRVTGLEKSIFENRLTGDKLVQDGPVTFGRETDLLFDFSGSCVIEDPVFARKILVEKRGSNSTVVWNPWIEKSRSMPDFGDEEYHTMLCVEAANAGTDARMIPPGKSHTMGTTISILK